MRQIGIRCTLSRTLRHLGYSLVLTMALSGCSRLRPKPPAQYVYVTAKQTYLRDRVAAVSNRVGTVENGEKLEILEHGRRWLKVKTDKGEQGWIDEKQVATQEIFDQFEQLKQQHLKDPSAASAVTRDDVYLHSKPGRDTDRLYRLVEGEKLKLLERATIPKPLLPGQHPVKVTEPPASQPAGANRPQAPPEPPPPAMEDWWLVRDSKGDTGWLYSKMMDVDVPDAVGKYAEGQRMVGAYVLTTVNDPDAPQDDKNIPIYVTVLSPNKAGLTYDFDQVRVFTWNIKKHRYETAFREHNIEGYLPVEISLAKDPYGKAPTAITPAPTFSYHVLSDDSPQVVPDPVTGQITPGKTIVKTYRLEGNLVRRLLPSGTPAPDEAHPEPPSEKKNLKQKEAAKKHHR
jgi:hypothetical protein